MESITGALENSMQVAFDRWHEWASQQRNFIIGGKPGITEEEYEAVVWRFAAIGIKVGTSAAMSSRPGRLRLPIDGAGRRRRAD
jgi:hypothetical protein